MTDEKPKRHNLLLDAAHALDRFKAYQEYDGDDNGYDEIDNEDLRWAFIEDALEVLQYIVDEDPFGGVRDHVDAMAEYCRDQFDNDAGEPKDGYAAYDSNMIDARISLHDAVTDMLVTYDGRRDVLESPVSDGS